MAAVLASFFSAAVTVAGGGLAVFAVALALSLGRNQRDRDHGMGPRLLSLATLPVVAIGAGLVGHAMRDVPPLGDTLFVVGLSGAIWVRRFGPRGAMVGRLVTLPLIAVFVVPVPVKVADQHPFGVAVVALVTGCWVVGLQLLAERLGFLGATAGPSKASESKASAPPTSAPKASAPKASKPQTATPKTSGPTTSTPTTSGPTTSGPTAAAPKAPGAPKPPTTARRRIPASTKMAVQMATALSAAFVLGQWLAPRHWPWVVLSAFIVSSGNRGRGDVVWKGLLRLGGALGGTLVATAAGPFFGAGDRGSVVALFVVLGIAIWLRPLNYAYWAAGITAALSLLYAFYGEAGSELLLERLGGIVLGAALAIAAAWLVLPVRTGDVVMRRSADALAVLADFLDAARAKEPDLAAVRGHATRFGAALRRLEEVLPPLRAHRWMAQRGRSPRPHHADAIEGLRRCEEPVRRLVATVGSDPEALRPMRRQLGAARIAVGGARLAIAGRPAPDRAGDMPIADPHAALTTLDAELGRLSTVWRGLPRRARPIRSRAS